MSETNCTKLSGCTVAYGDECADICAKFPHSISKSYRVTLNTSLKYLVFLKKDNTFADDGKMHKKTEL